MATPLYLAQVEHIKRRVCQHFAIPTDKIITNDSSIRYTNDTVKKANLAARYLCARFIDEKTIVIATIFNMSKENFTLNTFQVQTNGLSKDIQKICKDIMYEDNDLFNIPPWEHMLFVIMPDYHPSKPLKQAMQQLHTDIENRIANSSDRQRFLLEGLKRQLKLENE